MPAWFDLLSAGVAGIAGAPPTRLALARWLLTQAAVLHSPGRPPDRGAHRSRARSPDWEWAIWLPHLVPPDSRSECRRLVGADPAQLESRVAELLHLINERQEQAASPHWDGPGPAPVVLVVVDGARRMRSVDGLAELLRRGPELGVVALCLEGAATSLPAESRVTGGLSPPADALHARGRPGGGRHG